MCFPDPMQKGLHVFTTVCHGPVTGSTFPAVLLVALLFSLQFGRFYFLFTLFLPGPGNE